MIRTDLKKIEKVRDDVRKARSGNDIEVIADRLGDLANEVLVIGLNLSELTDKVMGKYKGFDLVGNQINGLRADINKLGRRIK